MESIPSLLELSCRKGGDEHIAHTNCPLPCRGCLQDDNNASRSLKGLLIAFSKALCQVFFALHEDNNDNDSPPLLSSFVANALSRANDAWDRGAPESFGTTLKRKIALPKQNLLLGTAETIKCVASIHKFVPEQTATVYAIAKILYELSALHEFAVLPVRRNEEELNLELSQLFSQDRFLPKTYCNPWGEIQFGKILEDLGTLAGKIAFDVKGNNVVPLIITTGVDRIRVC
jgi:hypothetical protein